MPGNYMVETVDKRLYYRERPLGRDSRDERVTDNLVT